MIRLGQILSFGPAEWLRRFSPEQRLAAAAFVVAAVYVPDIFSGAYMPRWWAIAVLVPLASELDPRRLPRAALACLAVGIAWVFISVAWAPIPAESALDAFFLALLAVAMIAGANVDDLSPAMAAFAWGFAISAFLSAMQWAGMPSPAILHKGPAGLYFSTEVLAETAAPLVIWSLWKRRFELAAVCAIPVALCDSRIAVAAVGIGLLWGWRARSAWLKAMILIILAAAGVAAVLGLGMGKAESGLTRMVLWLAGIQSITPFGRGIGWWAATHLGPLEEYAHSDALQLLAELGFAGAVLLMVPLLALRKGGGDVAERSAFACLLFEAAVSFPLQVPAAAFLGALLAGRVASDRARVRDRRLPRRAVLLSNVRWTLSHAGVVVRGLAEGAPHISVRAASAPPGDRRPARIGAGHPLTAKEGRG